MAKSESGYGSLGTVVMTLLPESLQPKAKAVAAAVGSVVTLLVTLLPLVAADAPTWVSVVLGALASVVTSVGTYATPNVTPYQSDHSAVDGVTAVD